MFVMFISMKFKITIKFYSSELERGDYHRRLRRVGSLLGFRNIIALFYTSLWMIKKLPTSRKVLPTFQTSYPVGVWIARTFCPLSSSGQEKKCFGVGLGVFCVRTYPSTGCVTAEKGTGVRGAILGKMRPYVSKMRAIWAICTKSCQKCAKIGGEKSIIMQD